MPLPVGVVEPLPVWFTAGSTGGAARWVGLLVGLLSQPITVARAHAAKPRRSFFTGVPPCLGVNKGFARAAFPRRGNSFTRCAAGMIIPKIPRAATGRRFFSCAAPPDRHQAPI